MPPTPENVRVAVDRVLCSGHGVCAQTLPGTVVLDEWGYPILRTGATDAAAASLAIKLCPARALYLRP
ncbi:ferredoxin [Micropruina sonneratiae]|uniref:ferredoxin n=1 Tax=Micropruina sonneratiae TaxID=2986940 RepID=UPI002227D0EC|nr:ferredoxin [Micropruina sp. KQZ13P-5]MCW3158201.1 ferredoxin [Micropruina sp. KQZ13P-5]